MWFRRLTSGIVAGGTRRHPRLVGLASLRALRSSASLGAANGLRLAELIEMPANNAVLVFTPV
jgi:hypothetical protein